MYVLYYHRRTSTEGETTECVAFPLARKYDSSDNLFVSIIEALALKRDKEKRGVGMQRMEYAPDLIEFSHILFTHSPKAYDKLRDVLVLPDPRTLR